MQDPPRLTPVDLVRSKQRKNDHGEVFTPSWLVEAMLNLVEAESIRIDSRFLEPACGSGNFLLPVLKRKLSAVQARYGKSDFEKRHYSLLALMSIYGIELLEDNAQECRANLLEVVAAFADVDKSDDLYKAAENVLAENIVHGNALSMRTHLDEPISFAEWSYMGKGKFNRRDFRFDSMTRISSFGQEDTLFADLGKHEIFTPIRDHGYLSIGEIAEHGGSDE